MRERKGKKCGKLFYSCFILFFNFSIYFLFIFIIITILSHYRNNLKIFYNIGKKLKNFCKIGKEKNKN